MRKLWPLAALLVLGACAGQPSPEPSPPTVRAGGLPAGRTFVLSSATDAGTPKQFVAGTRVQLQFFDANRLGLTAGCNSMSGSGSLDKDRLVVGDLAATEIACPPERHRQDEWLAAFLTAGPNWRLTGDTLVLTARDAELRFVDRKSVEPDRQLAGSPWRLDTVLAGESASSVPVGVQASLTFDDRGGMTGSTGCNTFRAKFAATDRRIIVTDLVSTKKGCNATVTEFERTVLRILALPMSYRIEANRLTLTVADGAGLQLAG
jgi:heat shock protein HslJ